MDITKKDLVDRLVEAGMPVSDAEKFVDHVINTYKQKKPNADDLQAFKFAVPIVMTKIATMKRYKAVCYNCTIIAVDEPRDAYDWMKRVALAKYRQDPQQAILNGYVKVEGDNVIPLDWKKKTGEPLPTRIVQDIYAIVDIDGNYELKVITFDEKAPIGFEIGKIYNMALKLQQGRLYATPIPAKPIEEVGIKDPRALFNQTLDVLSYNNMLTTLDELTDNRYNYKIVATTGNVIDFATTRKGMIINIEDYHNPSGIGARILYNREVKITHGQEILVIGQVRQTVDQLQIYAKGVIPNPEETIDMQEFFIF